MTRRFHAQQLFDKLSIFNALFINTYSTRYGATGARSRATRYIPNTGTASCAPPRSLTPKASLPLLIHSKPYQNPGEAHVVDAAGSGWVIDWNRRLFLQRQISSDFLGNLGLGGEEG